MEPRTTRFTRLLLLAAACLPFAACSVFGASGTPAPSPASAVCGDVLATTKTPGQLTMSTTNPAYNPWFEDEPDIQYAIEPSNAPAWQVTDPYSLHGFEDGTVYSMADAMGVGPDSVRWVPNTREDATSPGIKNFDIFVGQVPIPSGGSSAVDFSEPYLDSVQAVVAEPTSAAANAASVADLRKLKLGFIDGSPSEQMVASLIKPDVAGAGYPNEIMLAAALRRGDIEAIVTDIATAFLLIEGPGSTDPAPVRDGVVVGKFPATTWVDHFGMVVEKGSRLLPCVNAAIAQIERSGSLDEFRNEDIPVGEGVPEFK
jgi:polar amino acid transport system substrate-binding protein